MHFNKPFAQREAHTPASESTRGNVMGDKHFRSLKSGVPMVYAETTFSFQCVLSLFSGLTFLDRVAIRERTGTT